MKIKRLVALLTVVALLVLPLGGLTVLAADATSGTWQNGFTWSLDGDGTLTIDGQGDMFDPPSDYDVSGMDKYNRRTRISPWCLDGRIKRVVFTGNVTSVGNYAFYACSSLESVAFPAGLKRIGTHAFEATPLLEADIPDTVTVIDQYAFQNCGSLAKVHLPAKLDAIRLQNFRFCKSLESVEIPVTVAYIGTWAFDGCESLRRVTYAGSRTQWEELPKERYNEPLLSAAITFLGNAAKIVSQPADATGAVGQTVSFTVGATGEGLTYQWYFKKSGDSSFTAWNKKTAATVSTPVYASWHRAQFYCVVKDAEGKTLRTNTVTLTVTPKITSQPANATGAVDDAVTFAVRATGAKLSYQWYFKKEGQSSFTAWNKKTAATVATPVYASWHRAQFYCVVKDAEGKTLRTNTVTLTVTPKITRQPANASAKVNGKATFTVQATGAKLYYRWYYKKSGASSWTEWYSAEGSPSATLTAYRSWNGAKFYCRITDAENKTVKTNTVTLTVK